MQAITDMKDRYGRDLVLTTQEQTASFKQQQVAAIQRIFRGMQIEERPELSKWESSAMQALEHDGQIQVLAINIRRVTARDQQAFSWGTRWLMIFKFLCPCGEAPIEVFPLRGLWKSQFDRYLKFFRVFPTEHLKGEGLL